MNYFLTRQKNKIRNALANNMSTDIKWSKEQLSKIIQSEGFLSALLGKFLVPVRNITVLFAKDVLAQYQHLK